jgi:flagellar biosynthesis/type III secretory pathway chaperone
MTLKELENLNQKFQTSTVQLSDLMPSSSMVEATSLIIRSLQKLIHEFRKLNQVASEDAFNTIMDTLETEIDEILFILDQLDIANKKNKIALVNDYLKEGYDLLSVYSKCFDSIINQRIEREE